jgi:hypothetical protein
MGRRSFDLEGLHCGNSLRYEESAGVEVHRPYLYVEGLHVQV